MSETITYEARDLDATMTLGRCLAELLQPATVIALIGPLGAGKTFLTRAIAEGLGIAESRRVCSPTFVLIQEYDARLPIYHFDAYRLSTPEEFVDLGAHEYFQSSGVCLVEWGDRVEAVLPADHLRIAIDVLSETSRRFTIEGTGQNSRQIAAHLDSALATLHENASPM
jgi:tRNA threonylcarbamoyladenosine biosynthesis protein TsaE